MAIYPVKRNGKVIRGKYLVRLHHQGKPLSWIVNGTHKQAELFESERKAELRAKAAQSFRVAPSFLDFSTGDYKVHARRRLAASTWKNRRYQVADLAEHFGPLALDEITTAHVVAYQNAKLDAGVREVKINDDLKVFHVIIQHALDSGVPATMPKWAKLKERKTKGRATAWTPEEVERLFRALELEARGELPDADGRQPRKQKRHKKRDDIPSLVPMVALMLNCGLRKGEVLALEWSCVDLERGILRIWPNDEWQPKNGEPREVPFGAAVRPWLAVPAKKRPSPRWVFPSSRRDKEGLLRRFTTWPQSRFDAARDHARLEGGPHQCRHTFASHFLQACPDMFLLGKLLGHSHQRVTAIYSHLLPDHLERARDAVSFRVPLIAVSGDDPETVSHGERGNRGISGSGGK